MGYRCLPGVGGGKWVSGLELGRWQGPSLGGFLWLRLEVLPGNRLQLSFRLIISSSCLLRGLIRNFSLRKSKTAFYLLFILGECYEALAILGQGSLFWHKDQGCPHPTPATLEGSREGKEGLVWWKGLGSQSGRPGGLRELGVLEAWG